MQALQIDAEEVNTDTQEENERSKTSSVTKLRYIKLNLVQI